MKAFCGKKADLLAERVERELVKGEPIDADRAGRRSSRRAADEDRRLAGAPLWPTTAAILPTGDLEAEIA